VTHPHPDPETTVNTRHASKTYDTVDLYEHNGQRLIQIAAGRRSKWYKLTELASDFGYAVRLHAACGDRLAADATSYDVVVSDDGCDHCDCISSAKNGYCRHITAVRELLSRGELAPTSAQVA
jgi:hypothetical protein